MPLPRMTDDQLIDYVLDQPMNRTEAMRWLIEQVKQRERLACADLADALRIDAPALREVYRANVSTAIRSMVP